MDRETEIAHLQARLAELGTAPSRRIRDKFAPSQVAGVVAISVAGAAVLGFFKLPQSSKPAEPYYDPAISVKYAAEEEVRGHLRDPSSARFQDVFVKDVPGRIVCGYVNAKNGFGGYTGFQPFVVEGNLTIMDGTIGRRAVVAMWNSTCVEGAVSSRRGTSKAAPPRRAPERRSHTPAPPAASPPAAAPATDEVVELSPYVGYSNSTVR